MLVVLNGSKIKCNHTTRWEHDQGSNKPHLGDSSSVNVMVIA